MYIIITEDGPVYRRDTINNKILKASDDGKVKVVRIDGPLPMIYRQNVWEPVDKI